ncbi:hypothetical protein HELRODRAFT_74348 [Helobdella robusta]|uniref:G-protein coupled receptors family 1 profile domain-containing protein n=1 Tax=Helobdella robusta TaxID=6412 RepID=T1G1P8_HELRO|nr:hypothetical protein HELRODRAFT_74348 [Helobdella robusta]ESO08718.1 hypothetical protein HELRODRAFT_74348 [Helobdella robusta]
MKESPVAIDITIATLITISLTSVYIDYVQVSGEVIIAIITILTNGLVLLAIATYPSLQTVTNYFVASLSTADLFVGLIGIPCVLTTMYQLPENFSGCLTLNTMIVILTQISIFSLLVIAVDRLFCAIRYPFEYNRICTPKRAVILIIITWVLSVVVTLMPSFAWNLKNQVNFVKACEFRIVIDMRYMVHFNFFGCVLTPLIIMIILYCYIFSVVLKQMRSIAESQMQQSSSTWAKDIKAAKWFAVVLFCFILSWLPMHTINCISVFNNYTNFTLLNIAILLTHLNSAFNPVLYALGNSKFEIALRKLFHMKLRTVDNESEFG